MNSTKILFSAAVVILLLFSVASYAQLPAEFKQRRQVVLEKMEPNSVLVLRSNEDY